MCGICGICLDQRDARVGQLLLEEMTSALAHRGPDGEGFYVNGRIGMGHRRLSIIDLVTGDQPIHNEDNSLVLVLNGEIYNYCELRDDLLWRGHTFSTNTDTEVIVHLYEDFGDECVHHLNGMFAFAIWDKRRQRLFAARDRLGEKPLYYHRGKKGLLFASELKSILKDSEVSRDIDSTALDDFLAYGYIPAPRTMLKSVRKLPAAHTLVFEDGRVSTKRYWSPSLAPQTTRTEDEYVGMLRELIVDSIRLRLRSDVEVGAFLSGGMDSNGIVALTCGQLDRPLKTFSVGFEEQDYNELALARMTAEKYQTEHHEIIVKPADVSAVGELIDHFDEPFGDSSMLPTFQIAREARKYVKVCISGDGGDELFGGYDHYLEAIRWAWLDDLPGIMLKPFFKLGARLWPDWVPGKGTLGRFSASPAGRYQRQIGIFDIQERRRLLRTRHGNELCQDARLFEAYFSQSNLDVLSRCQLMDQQTYLPEDILVKVDRAAMRTALEVRIPFLDHRVVELANGMPSTMKIRGGQRKRILRRVLTGVVPQKILDGPKRGFGVPLKYWFRDELSSFARDMLASQSTRISGIMDGREVRRILQNHERGGRDLSDRVWALVVLEHWCRANGV